MSALRITEIFLSLQSEANTVGRPTVFVRLTGCPLRCQYFNSEYVFSGGEIIALDDILAQVKAYAVSNVTVAGGDPLAQLRSIELVQRLVDDGYFVSLETSGALSVEHVQLAVSKALDMKTSGLNEAHRNPWENLQYLTPRDQIKFVLCGRGDYDWARMRCDEHDLYTQVADVLLSPSHHELAPRELADWVVADRLPVSVQMQMHKLLWGDVQGR